MYEIFDKLLKEKGIKTSDVARATGLSATFFSEWKKGKSKTPSLINMQKIANYFGVTVDYLLTGEEKIYDTPTYSDDYFEIVSLYSQLTDAQKETVLNMLRSFVSNK